MKFILSGLFLCLMSLQVEAATIVNSYRYSTAGTATLQNSVASTVFELEAPDSASYSGSGQTWLNLITTPADGTSRGDWDLYLGATSSSSTDDPTFNGSAGSSGAYFSMDGGDLFVSTQVSDVSPGFLAKMARSDDANGWWYAVAFRYSGAATMRPLQNNNDSSTNGIAFNITTSLLRINRYRAGSTIQTTNLINSANSFVAGTDYLVIISTNSARNNIRHWKNSRTAVDTANSWTSITADAAHRHGVGANYPTNTGFDGSGIRYYAIAGGNEYLDDTKAGQIIDYLNLKHGRTYAP